MSLEEDILVVVSVLVIDCNLRNEREREREREREIYISRSLELGQVYFREMALNPKWADRILSFNPLYSILGSTYYCFFLDIFVFCLTNSWLSCQSLCNWPAFTLSGPFPTTSLSSSPFLLLFHSPLRN